MDSIGLKLYERSTTLAFNHEFHVLDKYNSDQDIMLYGSKWKLMLVPRFAFFRAIRGSVIYAAPLGVSLRGLKINSKIDVMDSNGLKVGEHKFNNSAKPLEMMGCEIPGPNNFNDCTFHVNIWLEAHQPAILDHFGYEVESFQRASYAHDGMITNGEATFYVSKEILSNNSPMLAAAWRQNPDRAVQVFGETEHIETFLRMVNGCRNYAINKENVWPVSVIASYLIANNVLSELGLILKDEETIKFSDYDIADRLLIADKFGLSSLWIAMMRLCKLFEHNGGVVRAMNANLLSMEGKLDIVANRLWNWPIDQLQTNN